MPEKSPASPKCDACSVPRWRCQFDVGEGCCRRTSYKFRYDANDNQSASGASSVAPIASPSTSPPPIAGQPRAFGTPSSAFRRPPQRIAIPADDEAPSPSGPSPSEPSPTASPEAEEEVSAAEEEGGQPLVQAAVRAGQSGEQPHAMSAHARRVALEARWRRHAGVCSSGRPDQPNDAAEEVPGWGRAGACVVRLTHYLQGINHMIFSLLYSDDEWLIGRTDRFEIGLMLHMFILAVINAPFAWH